MEKTEASPPATAAIRAPQWWAAAGAALAVAMGAVLLGYGALYANGNWFTQPPSITVQAIRFNAIRGTAVRQDDKLLLQATDAEQAAVLAAQVPRFAADAYPRVEFKLRLPGPAQPPVALLWTTVEQPTRTFSRPLVWVDDGVAPLDLDASMGWTGTVAVVALAVRGTLLQPLILDSVTLPGVSAATALADLADNWTDRAPFRVSSIAFPFDEERYQTLSLPAATALAVALALVGYLVVARQRRWPLDARTVWAIFLAGWLLLDARWQVNLWRQLRQTADEFAGRTGEEKHLAAVDSELYALMREVKAALPAAPVRIVFLSDNVSLRARGGFFLYPHSVNSLYGAPRGGPPAIDPDALHPGDHVLLLLYRGATYDRDAKALVWSDGRRKAVDELLYTSGGVALLRIR